MLLRLSLVSAGLLIGIAAASMLPQVPYAARSAFTAAVSAAGLGNLGAPAPSDSSVKTASKGEDADSKNGPKEPKDSDGRLKVTAEQIAAANIESAKISGGQLSRRLSVPGTIVPASDRVGRVAARVVGTVTEMYKQLGDFVEAGEVVAAVDSREVADAKSEYLAANVNFDLQKTLFEREQSLFQSKISAEQQFLRARTSFAEVQLRMDLARQKLAALGVPGGEIRSLSLQSSALQRYEIRAPLAGRIVERIVNLGAAVGGEGQPKELYGIADLSVLWVDLAVPPRDLANVKEGQAVEIWTSGSDERVTGSIVFKSPILNQENRTARVVAQFLPAQSALLQPGAFVVAEIILQKQKVDVVVPKGAIQTVGKNQVVFVRVPDGFEKRDVAVGRTDGRSLEITAGLVAGEEIALTNAFTLKAELEKASAE